MNDVMKILKEEEYWSVRADHLNLNVRIIINFRVSAREKIINRLSRIEGLEITDILKLNEIMYQVKSF